MKMTFYRRKQRDEEGNKSALEWFSYVSPFFIPFYLFTIAGFLLRATRRVPTDVMAQTLEVRAEDCLPQLWG